MRPAAFLLPLAAITLCGALLRFAGLGTLSLGADEGFTAALSLKPLAGFFRLMIIGEASPPLFFLLTRLFGALTADPFWLRLVPALAGVLLIPATAVLGVQLFGKRSGILAGALVALSQTAVFVAQEARPYSLLALFTVLSWSLLLATQQKRSRFWLYAAVCLLGLYTHYFMVFTLAAQFVWVIATPAFQRTRELLLALLIIAAGCIPLVRLFMLQSGLGSGPRIPAPQTRALLDLLIALPGGMTLGVTAASLLYPLLILVLSGFTLLSLLRAPRRPHVTAVLLALLVPVGGLLLLEALRGAPLFQLRYLLYLVPFLALAATSGIDAFGKGAGAALAVLACLTFCATNAVSFCHWLGDPAFQRENWRDSAAFVSRHILPEDAVVVQNTFRVYAFEYYFRKSNTLYLLNGKDAPGTLPVLSRRHPRLWLVSCQAYLEDPQLRVLRWMEANLKATKWEVFPNALQGDSSITVIRYETDSPAAAGGAFPSGALFADTLRKMKLSP